MDIETQGSRMPTWLLDVDLLVISPKAPSSKQPDVYETINGYMKLLLSVKQKVAIKIPVFDEEDFEFAQKYYTWFGNQKIYDGCCYDSNDRSSRNTVLTSGNFHQYDHGHADWI